MWKEINDTKYSLQFNPVHHLIQSNRTQGRQSSILSVQTLWTIVRPSAAAWSGSRRELVWISSRLIHSFSKIDAHQGDTGDHIKFTSFGDDDNDGSGCWSYFGRSSLQMFPALILGGEASRWSTSRSPAASPRIQSSTRSSTPLAKVDASMGSLKICM